MQETSSRKKTSAESISAPTKSETETEAEAALTEQQYQESIRWKLGEPKAKAVKKKKNRYELIKRLIVGIGFMAMYINSYLVSTVAMAVMPYYLMIMVSSELLELNRDASKDSMTGIKKYEWGIIICGQVMTLHESILNRTFLINSGLNRETYPQIYNFIEHYYFPLCLILTCMMFTYTTLSL